MLWQTLKEIGRKGLAVLGTLELADSLYHLVAPDTAPKIEQVDDRLWYGIAFVFLITTALIALNKANTYRKRLEGEDNIRIVYNEKRYPVYVVSKSGTIRPLEIVDTLEAMPLPSGIPIIIPSCF
jgi:hypothetical protein